MAEKRKDGDTGQSSAPSTKDGSMPPPSTQGEVTSTRKAKKQSDAWVHFTKFVDENGKSKARCNYCGTPYACDSKKNGTTSLNNHMGRCKKFPGSIDLKQSQLSLQKIHEEGADESVVAGHLSSWRFDQDFCRLKLVEMIIKDELAFKIVEGEGFREFVAALQPKFRIPSRWTISRDVYKMFLDEKIKLMGGKFLHMRCVAHIVNLVVKDGLQELDVSVTRIREAVRFIRHSPARIERFQKCCKEENIECKSSLCLDVPTRWNATYLMLDVACKFEKAFELFEAKDPFYKIELDKSEGVPETVDWENAKKLSLVLKTFYELTIRISGSLYVTSNTFLHEITNMYCLLKEWVTHSSLDVRGMGVKMKEKFDKYWGDPKKMNKLIFFSVVVDPRYKFEFLEFLLVEVYGNDVGGAIAKSVKDELYELLDAYKSLHINQPSIPTTTQEKDQASKSQALETTSSSHYLLVDKFKKQKRAIDNDLSNDLDLYLAEKERGVDDSKGFNILAGWKVNQHRLPILARLARDILSVPISTVASESAFSTGGRVLDPFRSSLSDRIVESLICTQDWLRKSKQLISIEEDLEGIKKHEEALISLGICEVDGDEMET